jgi:chemotaxis protein MotB
MPDNPFDDADDSAEDDGGGEWIVTFADMSTLLLTFFVLLVSMANFEKPRFASNFASVRQQFGGSPLVAVDQQASDSSASSGATGLGAQDPQDLIRMQEQTYKEIQSFLTRTTSLEENVRARIENGKITLTVPADVMFAPGMETVLPGARPFLLELRELFLKERQEYINIKGYTDDSPLPEGARFKDNWELSALRAVNILREMLDGGIEAVRMTATGLADMNPVAPNTSEENRALNRRVEFELEQRTGN